MKHTVWVVKVLCVLAVRANGDEGKEECSQSKSPNNDFGDDMEENMNVELLQKDVSLQKLSGKMAEMKCEELKKQPFPKCKQADYTGSFQVTSVNYDYANVSEWDPANGDWKTLVQLDASLTVAGTGKKFRNINSCAINPKDNSLYCSMQMADGSFLTRIGVDPPTVGFLAKLRQWRWAATFDEEDNYYVYGEEEHELGTLNVVSGVSKLGAVASYTCEAVQKNKFDDYSGTEKVKVGGKCEQKIYLGADLAYVKKDNEKYLAALAGTDMKLLKISTKPFELIALTTVGLPQYDMPMHPYKRVWGTAWSHQAWQKTSDNVYFSGDDGAGVYALSLKNNLDLTTGKAKFVPFGEATKTDWNDGFSCGTDPEMIIKSDCKEGKMYRSSTKNRKGNNPTSEIMLLDENTGEKKGGWKVEAEGLTAINACAMNPIDDMVYCILRFKEAANGFKNVIARLDSEGTIGYVARIEGDMAFSGVFDDEGNYYFYEVEFGLHQLKNINKILPASKSPKKAIWREQKTSLQDLRPDGFKWKVGADFAILNHDKKVYLASIMAASEKEENGPQLGRVEPQRVSLVEITGGKVDAEVIYLMEEGEVLPKPVDSAEIREAGINHKEITYGTAWKSISGDILFADDSGQGVYKLLKESVSITAGKGTVKFEKMKMKNHITEWNDGFVCDPHANKRIEKVK